MTKEQKRSKIINTDNRMVTINKRETSFQGLAGKFEAGQDSIYNLFREDKNIIFTPKISITEDDMAEVPFLRELRKSIQTVDSQGKKARGKKKYLLKKQLIQMRQDQYVIKSAYKPTVNCLNGIKSFNSLQLNDNIKINEKQEIIDNSLISLMNPKHISVLLCNYPKLKEDVYGKFSTDGYYLLQDLENLVDETLKDKYPLYYSLLIYKIDKRTNVEIQKLLEEQHGVKHSVEYISALWRRKNPKLIANQAIKNYLIWYYTEKEYGKWKRCSRCKEIKLAHNLFFSKNSSSKDGFYSICKQCRNTKMKPINKKPKIIKRIPYVPAIDKIEGGNN